MYMFNNLLCFMDIMRLYGVSHSWKPLSGGQLNARADVLHHMGGVITNAKEQP